MQLWVTYLAGYPSRVEIHFNNQVGDVVLDQIRAVDKSRLKKRLARSMRQRR
jgi:mRNA-degrading endonuclease toxin of MazEF toxin-antitoxin module